MDNINKVCTKCELPKELTEFHKDKKQDDGHKPHCKKCRSIARPSRKKVDIEARRNPGNRVMCLRTNGLILKTHCVPGCNDKCIPCENKQIQNVQAGSDTYTEEDERIIRHSGSLGGGMGKMIEGTISY